MQLEKDKEVSLSTDKRKHIEIIRTFDNLNREVRGSISSNNYIYQKKYLGDTNKEIEYTNSNNYKRVTEWNENGTIKDRKIRKTGSRPLEEDYLTTAKYGDNRGVNNPNFIHSLELSPKDSKYRPAIPDDAVKEFTRSVCAGPWEVNYKVDNTHTFWNSFGHWYRKTFDSNNNVCKFENDLYVITYINIYE